MNANQLVPAGQLANTFGVKALVYGDPGTGKTPIINTAPRPVLCATEPGLRSMTGSNVPTWEAYTAARAHEFFDWLFQSNEAAYFDTVCIDSVSQFAEAQLTLELSRNAHGKKAFGEMATAVHKQLSGIYYMKNKHVYLIAKKSNYEQTTVSAPAYPGAVPMQNTTRYARPYFPGQDLNIKVPHLYDEILHAEKVQHNGQTYPAFRTRGNDLCLARDRSGKLAEFEQMHLGNLFAKAMS